MKGILLYISRIIVGSVFITSGLIKANDTLGFQYKLEEYFEPAALGWTYFEPYSLYIGIIVCVSEIVLGLSLLIGSKFKLTTILIQLFLVFFAFLTYYTAQCDPNSTYTVIENGISIQKPVQCVLDCGCFGDAMKGSIGRSLTPWESFTKDMILLFLSLFLFLGFNNTKLNNERKDKIILSLSLVFNMFFSVFIFNFWTPIYFSIVAFVTYLILKFIWVRKYRESLFIGTFTLLSLIFIYFTYNYLPIKDYRAYKIGNNLNELKKSSDDYRNEILTHYIDSISKNIDFVTEAKNRIQNGEYELDTTMSNEDNIQYIVDELKMIYESDNSAKINKYVDSIMEIRNLLPSEYIVIYEMQNKKNGTKKSFNSIEYNKLKLWKEWDIIKTLINDKTGETKKINSTEYSKDEEKWIEWRVKQPESKLIKQGFEPQIPADFSFGDSVDNILLNNENLTFVAVIWNTEEVDEKGIQKVRQLHEFSTKNKDKIDFIALSSVTTNYEDLKKKYNLKFDLEIGDDKVLKTIIRSNPGIVILKNGIVKDKMSHKSFNPNKINHYIEKNK